MRYASTANCSERLEVVVENNWLIFMLLAYCYVLHLFVILAPNSALRIAGSVVLGLYLLYTSLWLTISLHLRSKEQ